MGNLYSDVSGYVTAVTNSSEMPTDESKDGQQQESKDEKKEQVYYIGKANGNHTRLWKKISSYAKDGSIPSVPYYTNYQVYVECDLGRHKALILHCPENDNDEQQYHYISLELGAVKAKLSAVSADETDTILFSQHKGTVMKPEWKYKGTIYDKCIRDIINFGIQIFDKHHADYSMAFNNCQHFINRFLKGLQNNKIVIDSEYIDTRKIIPTAAAMTGGTAIIGSMLSAKNNNNQKAASGASAGVIGGAFSGSSVVMAGESSSQVQDNTYPTFEKKKEIIQRDMDYLLDNYSAEQIQAELKRRKNESKVDE